MQMTSCCASLFGAQFSRSVIHLNEYQEGPYATIFHDSSFGHQPNDYLNPDNHHRCANESARTACRLWPMGNTPHRWKPRRLVSRWKVAGVWYQPLEQE